jgi:DNA invertase Pin-like site-specific DNA recombinase
MTGLAAGVMVGCGRAPHPPFVTGELIFHVFGAIAHFERRLIAERTKDGIAAARARGKRPGRQPLDTDRIAAALKLVTAGLSPTQAAQQVGLGRSTVYCELNRASLQRPL